MGRERISRFGSVGFVIGRSAMGFQNYFGALWEAQSRKCMLYKQGSKKLSLSVSLSCSD